MNAELKETAVLLNSSLVLRDLWCHAKGDYASIPRRCLHSRDAVAVLVVNQMFVMVCGFWYGALPYCYCVPATVITTTVPLLENAKSSTGTQLTFINHRFHNLCR